MATLMKTKRIQRSLGKNPVKNHRRAFFLCTKVGAAKLLIQNINRTLLWILSFAAPTNIRTRLGPIPFVKTRMQIPDDYRRAGELNLEHGLKHSACNKSEKKRNHERCFHTL